jgi:hypothetical protein
MPGPDPSGLRRIMARASFLPRAATAVAALCLLLIAAASAQAHFRLNTNIRIIQVERIAGGVRVYIRLPAPVVLGRVFDPQEIAQGRVPELPYVVSRHEDEFLLHYIDVEGVRRDPMGLGRLVADGHIVEVDGRRLEAEVEAVRVHPARAQPRFVEPAEVRAALDGPVYAEGEPPLYVGDAVIDVALFYATPGARGEIRLASTLAKGLPGEDMLANLVLDYIEGERRIHRVRGQFRDPLVLNESPWTAVLSFVEEGIWHILEGYDHVLFILCLTVGAFSLGNLIWRITGFTLGHTVTLIAGFLGYAPGGGWFIPAVEAAIAVSIVYAGTVALMRRREAATFVITALIGLLHGFGFSFVLRSMLDTDAPNLWVSLVSFNVGVEIGQVAIVAVAWSALLLIERGSRRVAVYGRNGISLAAIAIAALWTGERLMGLAQMALG